MYLHLDLLGLAPYPFLLAPTISTLYCLGIYAHQLRFTTQTLWSNYP